MAQRPTVTQKSRKFESHAFTISIKLLDQVDHAKFLGVVIDNPLSWSNHVDEILKADYDTVSNLLLEILKWQTRNKERETKSDNDV